MIAEHGRERYRAGHREGRVQARLELLLQLLDRRGLAVSDELRARLERCDDEQQLRRWFDRAVTVTRADQLLDES